MDTRVCERTNRRPQNKWVDKLRKMLIVVFGEYFQETIRMEACLESLR